MEYEKWYGCDYILPELHEQAVYGLPELFRAEIAGKSVVGNPGCYPTSVALGLAPRARRAVAEPRGIVIDSKSGVTGAGRKNHAGHPLSGVQRGIFRV